MTLAGKKLSQLSAEVKRRLLSELLGDRNAYPLSYPQRGLWFLDQISPVTAALNFPAAYRICGNIDITALERALNALVERNEAFRITCFLREGVPWQRVGDPKKVRLERISAAGWSEDELQRRVHENAARPFDLEQGPVFRATLFAISPSDHLLLLAWHHIVFDGWSLGVAISELGILYSAYVERREPRLAPAVPYSEFVRWQREMVHGDSGGRHRNYWKSRLQDVQPMRLPIELPRRANAAPVGHSEMVRFTFDERLTAHAKELARSEGATLYMVLLAAFFVLLERYCGRGRVLVSAPAAGRSEGRFARIAGCLVNQIVLSADVSSAMTFRDLLAHVKQIVLGAFDHQDYPLALLDPELLRLTGVNFVLHGGRNIEARLGPL
ncbi:MAG: hypothetical protein JOZ32_17485, partial [Bryobacterales bacterium]|nr:hypothetical protein [Bryobacterales bacterium]